MTIRMKMNDPKEALEYFQKKIQFSLGPVDLNYYMEKQSALSIIDVRDPEDFIKGHIPGAVNLPEERWNKPEGLHKDVVNVIYCYSATCHLAARAAVEFAKQGYPVMEMDGGFDEWKEHDFKVKTEKGGEGNVDQKKIA